MWDVIKIIMCLIISIILLIICIKLMVIFFKCYLKKRKENLNRKNNLPRIRFRKALRDEPKNEMINDNSELKIIEKPVIEIKDEDDIDLLPRNSSSSISTVKFLNTHKNKF